MANLTGFIANSLKIEHYLLVLSLHYFWKPPSTKICLVLVFCRMKQRPELFSACSRSVFGISAW